MLQHFQISSLYHEKRIPGWKISFYYQQKKYDGIYHKDGRIEWTTNQPNKEDSLHLEKQVHDLMIYHVYD